MQISNAAFAGLVKNIHVREVPKMQFRAKIIVRSAHGAFATMVWASL